MLSSVHRSRIRPGAPRVFEQVVPAEQLRVLLARDPRDAPVEVADQRVGGGVTAVPGQELGDRDAQSEPLARADHLAQVRRDLGRPAPDRDVVDASLDDHDVRSVRALLEPAGDLVAQLAGYAAVAEVRSRQLPLGPQLVLAAAIELRADLLAGVRVRVPARRPCRDRVAQCGDDRARARLGLRWLIRAAAAAERQQRQHDAGLAQEGADEAILFRAPDRVPRRKEP